MDCSLAREYSPRCWQLVRCKKALECHFEPPAARPQTGSDAGDCCLDDMEEELEFVIAGAPLCTAAGAVERPTAAADGRLVDFAADASGSRNK